MTDPKTKVKWSLKTDLPEFDVALDPGCQSYPHRHHDITLVWEKVDDVLSRQYSMNPHLVQKRDNPIFWKDLMKHMKAGKPVPMVVFEYDCDGKLINWQEGFRRTLVAKMLGDEIMPVFKARKRCGKYTEKGISYELR